MPLALLSVSDKRGIVDLGRSLAGWGWQIVSTGGTAGELKKAGIPVTRMSELTGFPEILGGRVKTLHPAVHGGILARRELSSDAREIAEHELQPIDLVAVNLYPFRKTVARRTATLAEALEQIDIGGPTLLRGAAKNHAYVWPVCDPHDYGRVLTAVEAGEPADELRRELAAKVFHHTAGYDAAIAAYLDRRGARAPEEGFAEELLASLVRVQELRYGENPDQRAAFYRPASGEPWGVPALEQLQGKALSYNNLLDVDGALAAIAPFAEEERAVCAILKHTTPCGIAAGRSALEAYEQARACDPISAFGSVVVFNQPVTEAAADALAGNFVECLLAPGYAEAALRLLQRKKNLRILRPSEGERLPLDGGHLWPGLDARGVRGGLLVQTTPAVPTLGEAGEKSEARVATERAPEPEEWAALSFAWAAVQAVKSNAILLARDGATIGIGAGQMSRVDAVRLAVWKGREAGHETEGSVLASDAFFPFRDGIDTAAEAGVRAIVQPGGSIRDGEVIEAAEEHGMAMVLTGRRLFRH
ncbi:MAG: bifunctional phosphoribosylaminoimidazolecarboxamide formyltransferase/IMP cyclohydrolase [Gemmatimonadota bacterium]